MAKFKLGSICLNELFAASKAGHSSVTEAKNGRKYASIIIWENEETDKYGNSGSIQLNPTKENKESEAKIYIGNLRGQAPKAQGQGSNNSNDDDIPF